MLVLLTRSAQISGSVGIRADGSSSVDSIRQVPKAGVYAALQVVGNSAVHRT